MVKKLLYHEFHPHPYICSLDHSYMHRNDLVSTDAHLMLTCQINLLVDFKLNSNVEVHVTGA